MSRVDILNQVEGGFCGISRFKGPLVIDRTSPGLNGNFPPNWTPFCDEVDEILKMATSLIKCLKYIMLCVKVLPFLLIILFILFKDRMFSLGRFLPMIGGVVVFSVFLFLTCAGKALMQTTTILSAAVASKSSNQVHYELKMDPRTKQNFILVHRTDDIVSNDEEIAPPPYNPEANDAITDAVVVDDSNTKPLTGDVPEPDIPVAAVASLVPSSLDTFSDTKPTTTTNTDGGTTNTGTKTSLFDQLKFGV